MEIKRNFKYESFMIFYVESSGVFEKNIDVLIFEILSKLAFS